MPYLTTNDQEEALSYAYLHAVASAAGMSVIVAPRPVDNHGIDVILKHDTYPTTHYGQTFFDIDVQLKASVNVDKRDPEFVKYRIQNTRHYDRLREQSSRNLLILVVLDLPPLAEIDTWLRVTPEQLILKNAAYWICLYQAPATSAASKEIRIPRTNLFTPEALLVLGNGAAATGNWPPHHQIEP